jgi:hypothetical protein
MDFWEMVRRDSNTLANKGFAGLGLATIWQKDQWFRAHARWIGRAAAEWAKKNSQPWPESIPGYDDGDPLFVTLNNRAALVVWVFTVVQK